MIPLPDDWQSFTPLQKEIWFSRNYMKYTREGETGGLQDHASDEIIRAYAEFVRSQEKN